MKLATAYKEKMYNSNCINDIVKFLTCNASLERKECMHRECKDKQIPVNDGIEMGRQVVWNVWKNKRVEILKKESQQENGSPVTKNVTKTVKEKEKGTLSQLNDEVQNEASRACRHIYNIRHQYKAVTCLKESLSDKELVLHINFSKNYYCKYHQEMQSMHFGASQQQISLHTRVAYMQGQIFPFTSISDCLKYTPAAIWAHLQPVFMFLNAKSTVHVLHILPDGPTTQCRNKQNVYLFSTNLYEMGFTQGTWNFFEASHGKGAADGIEAENNKLIKQ